MNFIFWKDSVDAWHRKLTLKVQFWHFLTSHNSLTDYLKKKYFEHVDSWPKILLFRTHQHHVWNSTTELILHSAQNIDSRLFQNGQNTENVFLNITFPCHQFSFYAFSKARKTVTVAHTQLAHKFFRQITGTAETEIQIKCAMKN